MNEEAMGLLRKVSAELRMRGINTFEPEVSQSKRWECWSTNFTPRTCVYCAEKDGKIQKKNLNRKDKPPVHMYCRCFLKEVLAIIAGTADFNKGYGADFWMKYYRCLPDNYVSKVEAKEAGWIEKKGNLREVLPCATIGKVVYENKNKKLPSDYGRIWYEADLNYTGGYRNKHRLLYSNDGLMFVTYDHYNTFFEVI